MSSIKVTANMDRMGNVIAAPVDCAWRRAFARHVAACTNQPPCTEQAVFFQEGHPAHAFISNEVPAHLQAALEDGDTIVFEADPRVVGHWYGYDAHLVTLES